MSRYYAPEFHIEVDGSRLKADVSKNIQHLQVVSSLNDIDKFTMTLANPLPTMRWTHTPDADLFKPGSMVKIAMGYADDGPHDMMYGEITQVSPSFPASGIPTVDIEGHSLMHRMRGENKTRTFQSTSAKEIAQQIGKDNDLQVQAEDVSLQMDYVIQPNQSDLEFLKELARSLHFELLVQNKTLIFRRAKEAQPRALTLVWYGPQESFTSGPNTMPLKSFSPQMNTLEPATSVQHRGYDPNTKQAIISNVSSSGDLDQMGGTQSGPDAAQSAGGRPRNVVHVTTPVASQQEADDRAKSAYNAKAMTFIEGNAGTIGIPELWSGQVVELKGLGPHFSGCYYVQQATHTIDESGYNTTFSVKRNAS